MDEDSVWAWHGMVPPEAALKDEITVEQWAYYAKTDGACKNAHIGCPNSAADHNYGMCGRPGLPTRCYATKQVAYG
jgi:hypothetical protein